LGVGLGVHALVAAHAQFEFRSVLVGLGDWHAAGVAEFVLSLFEPVPDRDPLVEHEALAVPCAVGLGDFFEVFEDPAFEVEHVLYPLGFEEAGGFLAADAAGAEHGDFLACKRVMMACPPVGELAEGGGLGVYGAFEGAYVDLVVVAGVDHDHVVLGDQCAQLSLCSKSLHPGRVRMASSILAI